MKGRKQLWTPSEKRVKEANITQFMHMVNESYNLRIRSYPELYRWSVEKMPDFWSAVWQYSGIRSSRKYEKVVDDLTMFPGAKWFQEARLNFAENLLGTMTESPSSQETRTDPHHE